MHPCFGGYAPALQVVKPQGRQISSQELAKSLVGTVILDKGQVKWYPN